ncbi:MAG: hypothetical protein HW416_3754 [Chloroflexi bacterium]|nr:hypothetical protein [Chloroflexota bacterium]
MIPTWHGFNVKQGRQNNFGRINGNVQGRLREWVDKALIDAPKPITGITTNGTQIAGLYSIAPSGVSTQPLMEKAEKYIASLNADQRAAGLFPIDSDQWRLWSNVSPFLLRHGVMLEEMSPSQMELALGLISEGLSAYGFETARGVMKLNDFIGEITGRLDEYGEWVYWLSMFGTPSADQPWGWQLDGHHLIVNFFVIGDQIVMTPTFMGSEPVECDMGKHIGTRAFQQEEAKGLAVMRSLTPAQQEKATLGIEIPEETSNFRDNDQIAYAGVRYEEIGSEAQGHLTNLIAHYTGFIRPGHADVRLAEVKRRLGETYFTWAGLFDDVAPFYYRIQSPVILVEFEHKDGIAFDNTVATRNHAHTVVRTPNGNDYGKDLLRQHNERFKHLNGVHVPRT